mmetsp:Transcript_24986/g.77147  ORF Transcript_24986/g.77147 Transcript_24986/m.77147 type:complete len:208 (+) Transcript_24986:64-687(+)
MSSRRRGLSSRIYHSSGAATDNKRVKKEEKGGAEEQGRGRRRGGGECRGGEESHRLRRSSSRLRDLRKFIVVVICCCLGGVEFLGFVGAAGGVAFGVGLGADAGELAVHGDDVLVADGLAGEEALEDFADAGGVAVLGREGSAGDVGGHGVVRHGAPGVVLGSGLREPDVSAIAGELSGLEGAGDGVAVAELAAGGVDEVGAALHVG